MLRTTSNDTDRPRSGGSAALEMLRLVGMPTVSDASARQIALEAQKRLRNCGYASLGKLQCEVANGVLTLRGTVPTYHLKQLAQSVVSSLADNITIVKLVEVRT